MCKFVAQGKLSCVQRLPKHEDKWGAIGKRLAALLTAGPLDKKKGEEVLFNKAARPCQATISPQRLPEMGERERAKTIREA